VVVPPRSLLSFSRYGEVRVFKSWTIFWLVWCLLDIAWTVCLWWMCERSWTIAWVWICVVAGKAVARSVNLAQARVTRLGKTCRSNQGWRRTLVLSEASLAQARATRLSEEEWRPGTLLWSSPGEGRHCWARGCLAQASLDSPKRACEEIPAFVAISPKRGSIA